MRDGIVAGVALSVGWVAEKDAGDGARCELMRRSGTDARVAQATEDAWLIVGGWRAEQEVMRCKIPTSATRTNVNE